MSVSLSIEQLLELAPNCLPTYRAAFNGQHPQVLAHFGINTTPRRLAHFVAQVMHETGALTCLEEDLDYSAARLVAVWPTRFRPRGPLVPAEYAHNPRKLANAVYGGRLGNLDPDDGYSFRGRGLMQLTGKDSYARAATTLFAYAPQVPAQLPDFVRDPGAVLTPAWCLPAAAAHWHVRGCNLAADRDDVDAVAHRINGGAVGMRERHAWYARTRALWQ